MAGYQAAVALKPDLVAAQLRLGDLYLAAAQRVEAAAAFRAAATAAAGTVTARVRRSARPGRVGRVRRGSRRDARHRRGASGERRSPRDPGQAARPRPVFRRKPRRIIYAPPSFPRITRSAWYGVATNRKFTAEDGPLIARMNAALARPNLTPRDRRSLRFALGKAHDDIGNYEAAMRNFEAGNRLRARGRRPRPRRACPARRPADRGDAARLSRSPARSRASRTRRRS